MATALLLFTLTGSALGESLAPYVSPATLLLRAAGLALLFIPAVAANLDSSSAGNLCKLDLGR